MTMTNDEQPLWTRKEVAEYLRLTERSVDMLRQNGKLAWRRVANNSIRFDRADVMKLVSERNAPAKSWQHTRVSNEADESDDAGLKRFVRA